MSHGVDVPLALHWVAWMWPLAQRLRAVAAWACGEVQEGQSEKEMNGGGARDYRVRKRVWDVLEPVL